MSLLKQSQRHRQHIPPSGQLLVGCSSHIFIIINIFDSQQWPSILHSNSKQRKPKLSLGSSQNSLSSSAAQYYSAYTSHYPQTAYATHMLLQWLLEQPNPSRLHKRSVRQTHITLDLQWLILPLQTMPSILLILIR